MPICQTKGKKFPNLRLKLFIKSHISESIAFVITFDKKIKLLLFAFPISFLFLHLQQYCRFQNTGVLLNMLFNFFSLYLRGNVHTTCQPYPSSLSSLHLIGNCTLICFSVGFISLILIRSIIVGIPFQELTTVKVWCTFELLIHYVGI